MSFLFLVHVILNAGLTGKKKKMNCLFFLFITFFITQIDDTPKAYIMFVTDSSDIYWRKRNSKGTASWT